MNYEQYVVEHSDINIKSICLGKLQYYPNNDNNITTMIPIYNNQKIDGNEHKNPFILKTPRLFIPYISLCKNLDSSSSDHPYIILSFIGEDYEKEVKDFKDKIIKLESRLKKLILKKKNCPIEFKNFKFKSIITDDKPKNSSKLIRKSKIYLPINLNSPNCCVFDINGNEICNWKFNTPTYGLFVLQFRNIWIKDKKWGINIYNHGGFVLPCELLPPPQIKKFKIKHMFNEEMDKYKDMRVRIGSSNVGVGGVGDSGNNVSLEYQKYFQMKKMGVPIEAIKHKIQLVGLDPKVIELTNVSFSAISLPPPPPPPMLILGDNRKDQISSSRASLLSQISLGTKLRKIDREAIAKENELKRKELLKEKIINENDGMIVPTEEQLLNSLRKLKSIDNNK